MPFVPVDACHSSPTCCVQVQPSQGNKAKTVNVRHHVCGSACPTIDASSKLSTEALLVTPLSLALEALKQHTASRAELHSAGMAAAFVTVRPHMSSSEYLI